ncbi:MAG: HAMP domain-containing histidine kinase [Lachnospiraceae bacterium]|jgi:signal transduction histidine kinase|nr:HAMP domain-containing histidine kinase [Lachnospiraceae bacterium]
MQKKSLKWFLIKNFMAILFFIYIAETLLGILYRQLVFPSLTEVLELQQITVSSGGSLFLFMIRLLLFYLVSLLPSGAADYLQGILTDMAGDSMPIRISSPFYQGWQGTLLTVMFLFLLLLLLGLSLLPYIAGALRYYKIVTLKVNELLEEEKERQLAFDRKRSLLLSDIAHDIKTPITTICGYSKALSEGVASPEKSRDYLDAIYGKAMRIDELITLLFEYVKLDSEGFCLHKKSGDLAELLRESVAAFYTDFEEKHITLTVDIPEYPVPCEMDSLQIERAAANLLTNALRYGKDGGRVLVRLKNHTISVADNGRAIDPDFAARIFEPFSREDTARTTKEGSGLGLSITAKIIEMHGGKLSLNSSFGEGYTKAFQIKMPESSRSQFPVA